MNSIYRLEGGQVIDLDKLIYIKPIQPVVYYLMGKENSYFNVKLGLGMSGLNQEVDWIFRDVADISEITPFRDKLIKDWVAYKESTK